MKMKQEYKTKTHITATPHDITAHNEKHEQ